MKSISILLALIFTGCSSINKGGDPSRSPSSQPSCISPSQECSLNQACRPSLSIGMINRQTESTGLARQPSIFQERISFIVKKNGETFEFLQRDPIGIGQEGDYYLWTDLNSDGTIQEIELTRPSVLNDIFTSRFLIDGSSESFRFRRLNYYEVDRFGNDVRWVTTGLDHPWSFFEYRSQACRENSVESDGYGAEAAP